MPATVGAHFHAEDQITFVVNGSANVGEFGGNGPSRKSLHRVDIYGDDWELFGQAKMRPRPLADNRCLMAI
jgi:hypothetical protein